VTTDIPADPERRVLLFGASVVASFNVPDGLSQLQRLLNERVRTRWEVRNLGIPAIATWQELELLKKTPMKRGDIIVFYDGGVDIDVCAFHGIPPRPPVDYISPFDKSPLTWYQRMLLALHHRFGKASAAAEIAFDIYTNSPPLTVTNPKLLENNLTRMTAAYEATSTEAAEFVEAKGGNFLHFLNPSLLTLASPDPYERSISTTHGWERPTATSWHSFMDSRRYKRPASDYASGTCEPSLSLMRSTIGRKVTKSSSTYSMSIIAVMRSLQI
jgi:hypothetical protein